MVLSADSGVWGCLAGLQSSPVQGCFTPKPDLCQCSVPRGVMAGPGAVTEQWGAEGAPWWPGWVLLLIDLRQSKCSHSDFHSAPSSHPCFSLSPVFLNLMHLFSASSQAHSLHLTHGYHVKSKCCSPTCLGAILADFDRGAGL